jgi:hypothetical protein
LALVVAVAAWEDHSLLNPCPHARPSRRACPGTWASRRARSDCRNTSYSMSVLLKISALASWLRVAASLRRSDRPGCQVVLLALHGFGSEEQWIASCRLLPVRSMS